MLIFNCFVYFRFISQVLLPFLELSELSLNPSVMFYGFSKAAREMQMTLLKTPEEVAIFTESRRL